MDKPDSRTTSIHCLSYADCDDNRTEIVSCLWPQGKHVWPGNTGGGGWCVGKEQSENIPQYSLCKQAPKEAEVWGTDLMWDFFSQHSRDRHGPTTVSSHE